MRRSFYRVSVQVRRREHTRRVLHALGITCLLLGGGALLLTLHVLRTSVESLGDTGFAFREVAADAAQETPAPLLPPELPEPARQPLDLPEVQEYAVEQVVAPELHELPLPDSAPVPELPELSADFPLLQPPPARQARVAAASARPAASAPAAAASAGEYTPPAYRKNPKPPYPAAMRRSRREGIVRLRVSIDAAGLPRQVEVVGSSGYAEFDSAAREWVLRHWEFEPARRGGQAVPGLIVTSVQFVLR